MKELLEQYLSGQYIIPMEWNNCLKSRKDLTLLLKGWRQMTSSETIGDPNVGIGVRPLIRLKIGDRRYVLNADTKRRGVEVFLENEKNENTWSNSETKRVSNASNGKHIENLQMYIV
jgi:hypothetical protein|tara:strand:- start:155 stop:505 length:351 start_codon:yes stop_codon:yes gene_type:complete